MGNTDENIFQNLELKINFISFTQTKRQVTLQRSSYLYNVMIIFFFCNNIICQKSEIDFDVKEEDVEVDEVKTKTCYFSAYGGHIVFVELLKIHSRP
jgi:hypothetical protein